MILSAPPGRTQRKTDNPLIRYTDLPTRPGLTTEATPKKARAFVHWNTSAIRGKQITAATAHFYNFYSTTCTATSWEIWSTGAASTATRWTNQPSWLHNEGTSTQTKGFNSTCNDGWVSVPAVNFFQRAATANQSTGYMGIRATSETSGTGWKQFRSRDAVDSAQVPYASITYNSYPVVATRSTVPSTTCVTGANRPYVNTTTPQLNAVVTDGENSTVRPEFKWTTVAGTAVGSALPTPGKASGSTFSTTVPAGQLSNGGSYAWQVRGFDGTVWGPWAANCEFTVDTVAPGAAPAVTSTAYPSGTNVWAGGAGVAGTFTFAANGTSDVAAYLYGLDADPPTTVVNAPSLGGNASVSITPTTDGPHTLYVRSRDRAGNLSPVTQYTFNVGAGAVLSPAPGTVSAGRTTLDGVAQPAATGVTYQWRRGNADTWATIPAGDVTLSEGGGAVTWPVATTGGGGFPKLNWNLEATLNAAEAGPDALDGPLQVRALYDGAPQPATSAVKLSLDRSRAMAATAQVGPGSVNLLTGAMVISASDVSVASPAAGLVLSRTYNSRHAGALDPMFGPGWSSSVTADAASAPYTGLTVTGSLVQVQLPDGSSLGFTRHSSTSAGATYDPEVGAESLTLSYVTAGDTYTLKDADGHVVVFTRPASTPVGEYVPTKVTVPGSGETAVSWETVTVDGVAVTRPTRMLAPVPTGVTCTPTSPVERGCRSLSFGYATTTTATGTGEANWGDYTGRLTTVSFTAYNPATGSTATTVLARYAYDNTGKLRMSWDPRLDHNGDHLGPKYTYDADGVLTELRPPGQEPWLLGYTTVPGDSGKGRLATATRSALSAGTATTTVVYRVPTTGGPYDMSAGQTARWGQTRPPVEATAVFPPDQIPTGNQASGVLPSSYERAAITYVDANGREVNTVAPGGYTTAVWYDQYGNTIRTLGPGNLSRALDAAPSDSAAEEAALAEKLSSVNIYSPDGQNLLESLGPEHPVSLPNGSVVRGRAHTRIAYDEGAPTGGPYNLPTTQTNSVAYTANGQTFHADARTTTTAYDWNLREPTAVTVDADGLALTTRTTYDANGLPTSVTTPGGGATDDTPSTRKTVYYRAGTGSGFAECDSRPEWANLVCRTQPGGQPAGGPELPVTVTTYDMFNQPTTKVEKTSAGVLRTTTTTYDAAGRMSEISTAASAGLGDAVPTTRVVYHPATGLPTHTRSVVNGTTVDQVIRTYDALGRQATYTDADGVTSSVTYDLLGRVKTADDTKFHRTYSYDDGPERRGLPTTVTDPLRGTITAKYNADGELMEETWPNGVVITRAFNEAGSQTGVVYNRPGCGQADCTVYAGYVEKNIHGQQRWAGSSLGTQNHFYDDAGRLTLTTDTIAGACTSRSYQFDASSNRTRQVSYAPATGGACQTDSETAVRENSYDAAHRINGGYTYDALGRTTVLPGTDSGTPASGDVAITYHQTDLVKSITQGSRTTSYTLDVNSARIRSWSDNNTGTAVTRRHHYNSDADLPAWTEEGDGTWTGSVTGLSGIAGLRTTAGIDWKITSLRGDLVATIHNSDPGLSATHTYDEHGNAHNPTDLGQRRYGWLGADQRAADTADGSVLMGVRLYNPTTARFLSVDPVPDGSLNSYEYCGGDSVNCTDLSGEAWINCNSSWISGKWSYSYNIHFPRFSAISRAKISQRGFTLNGRCNLSHTATRMALQYAVPGVAAGVAAAIGFKFGVWGAGLGAALGVWLGTFGWNEYSERCTRKRGLRLRFTYFVYSATVTVYRRWWAGGGSYSYTSVNGSGYPLGFACV